MLAQRKGGKRKGTRAAASSPLAQARNRRGKNVAALEPFAPCFRFLAWPRGASAMGATSIPCVPTRNCPVSRVSAKLQPFPQVISTKRELSDSLSRVLLAGLGQMRWEYAGFAPSVPLSIAGSVGSDRGTVRAQRVWACPNRSEKRKGARQGRNSGVRFSWLLCLRKPRKRPAPNGITALLLRKGNKSLRSNRLPLASGFWPRLAAQRQGATARA